MSGALLLTVALVLPPAAGLPGATGPQAVAAQTAQPAPPAQSGEPSPEALAEAYYEFLRALSLQNDGDTEGAVAALRRAAALAPRSADLRAELAVAFADQGRAFDAVTEAEAALAIDPDHRGAHRIMGFVQNAVAGNVPSPADRASMRDEAIRHFERVLEGGRTDLGVEYQLATLYLTRGRHAEAIETIKRFLVNQPGYADAWRLLAGAHQAAGDTPAAIAALTEFLALEPGASDVRTSLAQLLERAGRWREAAAEWARLGDAQPENASFRLFRATALANAGEVGAARAVLTALTAEQPDHGLAWYLLSQVELREGRLDEAGRAASRFAEIAPGDPRALLARADVAAARGDYADVIAIVRPRVDTPLEGDLTNGVHGRLAGTLAGALQEQGDEAGAVAVMEAASGRAPADGDLVYNLGTAYERAERYDDAERTFRGLIAQEPDHANALNYLGYMLADRDQKLDEALGLVQRALAIEPDNPSFLDSLGWVYFRLGRFDDARPPLEKAAAEMRSASVVQGHLGDLYFQLRQYRQAADAYDRALAGDMVGVDAAALTRKRDRARDLAGR